MEEIYNISEINMSFNDTLSRKKIIEYFPKKYLPEETFDILSFSNRSICDLRGIDVYGKNYDTYRGTSEEEMGKSKI